MRGDFPHPPDGVASPASEDELRSVLAWCGERDVAVVPVGGGTSVVGGIDARPGPGHAGVVAVNLRALDRVLEVDPVSRAARIQAGATGPRLEEQLGPARADAALLPAVVRARDARRLDRHARGRALRERADPHRRPRRIGARADSGRRRLGVAAAAGLGRRPVAGPDAARLGGHARGRHRGVGAGAAAARAATLGERVVPRVRRRPRRAARAPPGGPAAGQLPPRSTPTRPR